MEEELERQWALTEREKRQQDEELRANREKEVVVIEQGEMIRVVDPTSGQSELPPLDVPPVTPLTGGNLPLRELGISEDQDEEVLDLTKITFDKVNLKIIQESKRSCNRNPADPLLVTMETYIVPNITSNPLMIASTNTAFKATIKHNVTRMSKHIVDLQNRLYASDKGPVL